MKSARCAASTFHRRGITLAETALATFIVGILVCAALQSMGSSLQTHAFAKSRVQAVLLAEQLLAELSVLPWCEEGQTSPVIGRETGETTGIIRRNQLDDMDDFDGWSESPSKRDGTLLTGTSGQTRTVTINNVSASDFVTTVADNADSGLRLITVVVSDDTGELARSSALLSRSELGLRASRLEQRGVPND
ncbi:MAG: hypothetical protein JNM43_14275 [Planctomycetaceae bacterium]|nr:hypothetical protein [Planctomycetaceae bacterium]